MMMNKVCIILACILVFISNVGAVTIKGKTNLNSQYSVVLEYMKDGGNECTVKIPIKDDGSFKQELSIKDKTIIEWNIRKNDGMRQMPAGCYLYANDAEKIEFNYILNKCSEEIPLNLEITFDNELSKENKLLFDYYFCNYISKINKKLDKVKTSDQLLKDNKVNNKDIKDLLDFMSVRYKLGYRNKEKLTENDKAEILRVLKSDFVKKVKVGYVWKSMLTGIYIYSRTFSSIDKFSDALNKITKDFTETKEVDLLAKLTMEMFLQRYKLAGNFNSELDKFNKAVSSIKNKSTRDYLINNYKQIQYTVLGADMPDVTLVDTKGDPVKLTDFKGQYVYIDLWFVG